MPYADTMRLYGGLSWEALQGLTGLTLVEVAFGLYLLRERGQVRASADVSGGINMAFTNERTMGYWKATCDSYEAALAENALHVARVQAAETLER